MFNHFRVFVLILSTLTLVSCASSSHYDFRSGQMARETNCDGRNGSWNTCIQHARQSCPKGYKVIRKDNFHLNLGHGVVDYLVLEGINQAVNGPNGNRHMVFKCNK